MHIRFSSVLIWTLTIASLSFLYWMYSIFWWEVLPWYDWWLYLSVAWEFYSWFDSGLVFNRSSLPVRVQTMYPVRYWMAVWSLASFLWLLPEQLLLPFHLIGWVLLVRSVCLVASALWWKRAWMRSVLLLLSWVTLLSLQRWIYTKQLYWMVFMFAALYTLYRKKLLASVLLFVAAMCTHRPAIAIVALIIVALIATKKWSLSTLSIFWLCVAGLTVFVYGPWVETLLVPAVWEILWDIVSVQVTVWWWFQDWGTFLTVWEYWLYERLLVVLCIVALWDQVRKRSNTYSILTLLILFLAVRILYQLFFYQRMLWYLHPLLCIFGALWISTKHIHLKISVLFWSILSITIVWLAVMPKVWPLISSEEFVFLQQLDTLIDDTVPVVVSDANYSPRVQWRSQSPVIAPWLFDLNVRWDQDQWWSENRHQATAQQKCESLRTTYTHPWWYVRVWAQQSQLWYDAPCFERIIVSKRPRYSLYYVSGTSANNE